MRRRAFYLEMDTKQKALERMTLDGLLLAGNRGRF